MNAYYPISGEALTALTAAAVAGRKVEIEVRASGDCYVVVGGDIGEPVREVEFEPLTAPSVPEPVYAPEPEKVPA